jgi:hypothetical protein
LTILALVPAVPAAAAALRWDNKGTRCAGTQRVDFARLWGLIPGTDWVGICKRTRAAGLYPRTDGKVPSTCVQKLDGSVWAEWKYSNHPTCGARFEPVKKAGCFGPNRQVYSARLTGDLAGRSWEEACESAVGPNSLGKPDRCVKDALPTGIWGEWYSQEPCDIPLRWGSLKDDGCIKEMKTPDADRGGISLKGYRSYSSVLWNAGGDWREACRFAPIRQKTEKGQLVAMPFPTACVVADADDGLSWATTAIIGAGTAFIASPTGPYAIAASGAAIAVASKAAEAGLFEVWDTSLNVWGVFWVRDPACGEADAVTACPSTGESLSAAITCTCSTAQTRAGEVWGSRTYSTRSSVCRAALHAGVIPAKGGTVNIRSVSRAGDYSGSSRNGVATGSWTNRDGSFEFDGDQ